ncbi:Adenylyltransferase/sulfurtransferase MoeZ OS=Streptomyces microflavus OX=1919 GN=moeZ PE=4 SV=1 [Streptomyces microflavus]
MVLHEERLEAENVKEIFAQYDLIVDGTDNFATRYLVNDAAVLLNKPYVWGSIYRFDGQASVFWSEHGPWTAASTRSPRRRAWSPPAPRAACWVSCARRSVRSR